MTDFKKGSTYTRKQVYSEITQERAPDKLQGNWTTLYVTINDSNELLVFLNIGVPGRTGHNLDNYHVPGEDTVRWCGQPRSHSAQPVMNKLITSAYIPHFFARWNNNDPFTYLGVGTYVTYDDGHQMLGKNNEPTKCIQFTHRLEDANAILTWESDESNKTSFALEKHLEEFIIANWDTIEHLKNYDLHEEMVDGHRKKKQTDTGEIDIFALSKDKTEYLVVELKKGRTTDAVVGQIQRYINYIEENADPNQSVRGLIIALEDDKRIRRSLGGSKYDIDFYRYEVSFK